jgi:hypothetical protein
MLWAYPRSFREQFQTEMASIFRDCCREVYRTRGRAGLTVLWLHALVDLLHNVPKEYVKTVLRTSRGPEVETLSCSGCYSVIEPDWSLCRICGEVLNRETIHVTRKRVPDSSIGSLERYRHLMQSVGPGSPSGTA